MVFKFKGKRYRLRQGIVDGINEVLLFSLITLVVGGIGLVYIICVLT